jgi:outer membrane protein OmpA-like peptidoglycan-associated protein
LLPCVCKIIITKPIHQKILKVIKKLVIAILMLAFVNVLQAQQYTSASQKAIREYEAGLSELRIYHFDKAIQYLESAVKTDNKFIEAWIVLSEAYEQNNMINKQIEALQKAMEINPLFFPPARLTLAEALFKSMRYDEAKIQAQKFIDEGKGKAPDISKAQKIIQNTAFASYAVQHPVPFAPQDMSDSINTTGDEYWPSLSADGNMLVFTTTVPAKTGFGASDLQEDFYVSKKINGQWTKAVPLGEPLNTPQNEGAQSLTADGMQMVFAACNRREGKGSCDLYFTRRQGNEWAVPYNPGAPLNTRAQETQPCFSADGHQVYFASNRPGGHGGLDIWVSTLLPDTTWSVPVNLGDSINTPGDEQSPFIHLDGKTLYFSSNYHPGMGGQDLFVSHRKADGSWTTPQNLGYPINTSGNEVGLIVSADGKQAIYSSDRIPERHRDLFAFELPKQDQPQPVSYFKGKIYDAETMQPLSALFELSDLSSDSTLYKSNSDVQTGEFLVTLPVGKTYGLNVSRKGYLFYSENFNLNQVGSGNKPVTKNILLNPVKTGQSVVLKNIFFEVNSDKLSKESRTELNKIHNFLRQNPKVIIEIGGHTDDTGSDEINNRLSESRAKAVVDFLLKNGCDSSQITWKGYGKIKPIATNSTAEGRAQNRRTECSIIKIKD